MIDRERERRSKKQIKRGEESAVNEMSFKLNFAQLTHDGSVKIYNYLTFEILVQKKFARGGNSLKWLSTDVSFNRFGLSLRILI